MPNLLPSGISVHQKDEARPRNRQWTQAENEKTQEIVIAMARELNRNGGYVLATELEIKSLFSRVNLNGKSVLEVGCGTLPVTLAIPFHA